ncbi:beta-lactamase family protein [Rhizobium sp. KVB221]|uniref:Beta-lactamase family protein n=1 Tax=Rhizobium setariae TaxID=2801340 RepID=A0A937CQN7_9HYPH|nr:serine hydrolase domain-containing protein [Rhizobium setariae]MBL0374739.1 beta-lactamase family protein [Rhizobium setariae]
MGLGERVDRVIDEAVRAGRITGAVVLVYKDGEPVVRRAAGFADREAAIPVEFDTIFRLASVTKPIVAAAALAMVERGKLGLTDKVADHLPWFTPRTADGKPADITMHHLLTHTSGLVYDPALELLPADRAISCGLSDTDLDFEANFSRHNAIPLAFAPGMRWAYSFATDLLGAVIAKVHGGTLEDAVVAYVAGPLGMIDSRFHITDPARLAVPYGDAKPLPVRMSDPWTATDDAGWTLGFSPSRIFNSKAFQSGGAGMAGTADDIMRLLEALRAGGAGVLRPETVRMGFANQIGALEMDDPGVKFGYFGAVVDDPARAMTPQSRGTIRWGGVYGLNWFIDPEEKLSAVSVTNNALEGCMGAFPDQIVNAVYGV